MRCIVCNGTVWENVDHVRVNKKGMCLCTGCGFISYPEKYKTEDEIKQHYRSSYRQAPTAHNLFTGERKLYYHEHFLRPLIEEWKKAGKKPVVGEIGSAMGMFLAWISAQLECSHIHGTELTTTFRRVAHHEFGIKLDEDFDFSRKYDLIVSYHVLEHQLDADKWLSRYADALSESGVMYLGTPVWFREATNFGSAGFDLDYYWAEDHINCWSEAHLETIIRKAGLKILLKNDNVYGNTYLLSRKEGKEITPHIHNAGRYKEIAEKIKECWKAIQLNETALALETYPNCPAAWINHYEMNRANFDKNKPELEKFMAKAHQSCPNTNDTIMLVGDIHRRYENFEKAYAFFKLAEQRKPNNPTCLLAMANAVREKAIRTKDPKVAGDLFRQSLELTQQVKGTSMEMVAQAQTWIFHDQARIPMEGE
jgi:SAM-dependent methyltransferase